MIKMLLWISRNIWWISKIKLTFQEKNQFFINTFLMQWFQYTKWKFIFNFFFNEEEEFREGCFSFSFWKTAQWLSAYKNLNLYVEFPTSFVTNNKFSKRYTPHFPYL